MPEKFVFTGTGDSLDEADAWLNDREVPPESAYFVPENSVDDYTIHVATGPETVEVVYPGDAVVWHEDGTLAVERGEAHQ